MKPNRKMRQAVGNASRGVALVVTLMMMSVLTMMVVGLAGVMRNEQAAARNLTYQTLAEQVAEIGIAEGMASVLSNSLPSTAGILPVTAPGLIAAENAVTYLFSQASNIASVRNLEEIGTNSVILSTPAGSRSAIYIGMNEVRTPEGKLVGRYGWWVEDEGTKVNLNSVGANNTNLFLPLLTNFPISASWIFVTNPATPTNFAANPTVGLPARTAYLFTPEMIKDTSILGTNRAFDTTYRAMKGSVTTWSSSTDLTPWGTLKLNLADPAVTAVQIKAALTTNAWASFFGPNLSLSNKYGDLLLDQIAANIKGAAGAPVGVAYAGNYSNTSPNRQRQNLPMTAISQHSGPYLNQVRLLVDQQSTSNSVTVRLNFGIEVYNPTQLDLSGYFIQAQCRKFRFRVLINPASLNAFTNNAPASTYLALINTNTNTSPLLSLPNLYVTMGWPGGAAKPDSYWIGPEWNEKGTSTGAGDLMPFPLGQAKTNGLSGTNTLFQTNFIYQTVGVTFSGNIQIQGVVGDTYTMVDQVLLIRSDGTLVDWLSLDDFSQEKNYRQDNSPKTDNGQVELPVVAWSGGTNGPQWGSFANFGLWKTDPQVRFPNSIWDPGIRGFFTTNGLPAGFNARAWKRLEEPHNCTNTDGSVTGVSYLWPDPVTNGTTFTLHPHFVQGYLPTNGIRSVAQLGAIHTGIPWRTLRFQATPAAELAQGPPDWILMEVFTATNPSMTRPMININGQVFSIQGPNTTNAGIPTNSAGASRPWPLMAAMGNAARSLPVGASNSLRSNGVPVSLIQQGYGTNRLLLLATNDLRNVLQAQRSSASTNGWATNSGWAAARRTNSALPGQGLAFKSELLELAALNDGTLGEDVLEGELRGFMDLLTTRSDTFSVWSIGQGLLVVTNASGQVLRTNVMGEMRKQTVFQRIPQFDGNGRVTNYRVQTLYSRNHIVE